MDCDLKSSWTRENTSQKHLLQKRLTGTIFVIRPNDNFALRAAYIVMTKAVGATTQNTSSY
jgi:hypothetical protein